MMNMPFCALLRADLHDLLLLARRLGGALQADFALMNSPRDTRPWTRLVAAPVNQ